MKKLGYMRMAFKADQAYSLNEVDKAVRENLRLSEGASRSQ